MSIAGQVIEFIVMTLVYAAMGTPLAILVVHLITKPKVRG